MSGEGDKKPYGNDDGKISLKELKKYLDDNHELLGMQALWQNPDCADCCQWSGTVGRQLARPDLTEASALVIPPFLAYDQAMRYLAVIIMLILVLAEN